MDLNDYIGLEYADKGRGPHFDCWGLYRRLFHATAGIWLPSYDADYQASNHGESVGQLIEREIAAWGAAGGVAKLADLVILKIAGRPCHCGFALGDGRMLHTLRGHAAAIDRLDGPRWANRIEGIYRHASRA